MNRFILLLIACSVNYSITAQTRSDVSANVQFGFKAGANLSNMNFNKGYPTPSERIDPSWKAGFLAGFFVDVPVYGKLTLQPEYLYLQTRGENKSTGANYLFSYMSLPVLFKYPLLNRVSIMAGPQFDLLIKAKQDLDDKSTIITHDTEERSIWAVAALDFDLNAFMSLNARYLHGFNHIGIGQRSNVNEFKFEGVQLSASLKF